MKVRFSILRSIAFGAFVGLLAAAGFWFGGLSSWSALVSDRFFVPRTPHPSIVIVAIDDTSIQRIGRWPWDRTVHAELIRRIAAGGATVIGYDVNFSESQNDTSDAALGDAVRDAGNVILPIELKLVQQSNGYVAHEAAQSIRPITRIAQGAAALGHTNLTPDADGVVRQIPLLVPSTNLTSSFIQSAFAEAVSEHIPQQRMVVDIEKPFRIYFPGSPGKTFHTIAAADVLSGAVNPAVFAGRMVLVGATAPDLHDEQMVPTSYGKSMSGVEIHASILDTILTGHQLRPVPNVFQVVFLVLLGALIALIVSQLRGRWSTPLTALVWIGVLGAAFALFDRNWIMDVVWPTLVIVTTYALMVMERRARAEQERRAIKSVFSRYVSPSVVDAILDDPSRLALGGERRRMTVLFSDIRGFTSLAEGMKPEQLVALLNIYLERMTELVFAHDGVLDKYIGDAIMAFWNAPFDQPDHARRAVATALAMRDALVDMNASQAFHDGKDKTKKAAQHLRIGVGINTGDMVVGNIGGQSRYDYTVIGDNVNLASRVEGLTKEYGVDILITGNTAAEMGSELLARHLDLVVVKGKTEPMMVYEAMALRSRATPAQLRLAAAYEQAHDLYISGHFVACTAACAEILAEHLQDAPTQLLLSRSAGFISSPPPSGWRGEWVYTKK